MSEIIINETPPPIESNLIWFDGDNYAKTDKSGITICINGEPITLRPEQWHKIARESNNA